MTEEWHQHANSAKALARGELVGLVLFGSVMRSDMNETSDVDVLQIVPSHRASYRHGKYCFSLYTPWHLERMARSGSLFIRHLLREGHELDRGGQVVLEALRRAFVSPADHRHLLEEVRSATALLDVDASVYGSMWQRLHSLAAHLLRTSVYAVAHDRGCESFALQEVQTFLHDERIVAAAAIRQSPQADRGAFESSVALIGEYCGGLEGNESGSIEALIVNAWGVSELTVILGLRLLTEEEGLLAYEELDLAARMAECDALR